MPTTTQVLAAYRDATKRRFYEVVGRRAEVPPTVEVPADPAEALRLGVALGRREGYGTGLVDGTRLGLDVGLDALDAMLSQPVIFGSAASA